MLAALRPHERVLVLLHLLGSEAKPFRAQVRQHFFEKFF
jgi:hypothetical protein